MLIERARLYSILSITFAVIGIFFIGIVASVLAIVFASIALEKFDDESDETKLGLVMGLINLCVMGLIIMGTLFSIHENGIVYPPVISFLFTFGPCGYCAMVLKGIMIPILECFLIY